MSWDKSELIDEARCKPARFGGKEYLIAPFTLRRIKKVASIAPKVMRLDAHEMSEQTLDPFVEVIWQGLLGAYPKVTRDEVEDLPMTMTEINAAVDIILEQMGGQKKLNGAAPVGESLAASDSRTSTGTSSSQTSA